MEKIKAIADKPSTFIFKRLKKAIKLKITATKSAKQVTVFLEKNILNIQLIQELR